MLYHKSQMSGWLIRDLLVQLVYYFCKFEKQTFRMFNFQHVNILSFTDIVILANARKSISGQSSSGV